MSKQRVFLTGATGGMGFASLKEMLKDADKQDIVILARDSKKQENSCTLWEYCGIGDRLGRSERL